MSNEKMRYKVTILNPNSETDRDVFTYAYSPDQAKRFIQQRDGLVETDIVSVTEDRPEGSGGGSDDGDSFMDDEMPEDDLPDD